MEHRRRRGPGHRPRHRIGPQQTCPVHRLDHRAHRRGRSCDDLDVHAGFPVLLSVVRLVLGDASMGRSVPSTMTKSPSPRPTRASWRPGVQEAGTSRPSSTYRRRLRWRSRSRLCCELGQRLVLAQVHQREQSLVETAQLALAARRAGAERERCVPVGAFAVRVLAVDDPGLGRVQPQPDCLRPVVDRPPSILAWRSLTQCTTASSTYRPNRTPGNSRAISIERVVEEQVRQDGRGRRRPLPRGRPVDPPTRPRRRIDEV